jgi:methylenetetrahydrofolate reductase (NADPH)
MARRTPASGETTAGRAYRRRLVAELTYEIVPLASAEAAVAALPPTSTASVTCSPVKGVAATAALTDHLRRAGHTAIPHLAARMVNGPEEVTAIAAWLRGEGINRIFVIAGDAEHAAGPYPDGISFLRALLDAGPGVADVGIPAYPDGHPLLADAVLHEALTAKQALLAEAGIAGHISTQMCFDPAKITAWLTVSRQAGITLPVQLGVPGVIDRAKLMTMGVRLGVGASLRYLRKNRGAMGRLLTLAHYDPNQLLEPLSPSLEALGVAGVHCFTFNQVAATAAWQHDTLVQLA